MSIIMMHVIGLLQEVHPDTNLDALPHAVALARHERNTKVDFHPHSVEFVHESYACTHRRLADAFAHAVNQTLGCTAGKLDERRIEGYYAHLSRESSRPRFTKLCSLTGQCGLFGMSLMTLNPAAQYRSPPSESANPGGEQSGREHG